MEATLDVSMPQQNSGETLPIIRELLSGPL
jgi:hypothetical protein